MEHREGTTKVARFRFASFGAEPEKPVVVEEVIETVATMTEAPDGMVLLSEPDLQERLEQARQQGKAEGFLQGQQQAQQLHATTSQQKEDEIKAVLELMANRITLASQQYQQQVEQQKELITKLILAVARKMVGNTQKNEPYQAVENLVQEVAFMLHGNQKVVVSVSESLSPQVKARIEELRPLIPDFEGELVTKADAGLQGQDCRVEWKNGYGEYNSEALWQEIERIIARITLRAV